MHDLDFFYGKEQALFANDLEIKEHRVTAIIGPSGCGKSTHLRCYNRIYELYRDQKATGEVVLDGQNILSSGTDLLSLRRRVGMIFQKPSPFPMTVFDNIAYGLRMHFKLSKSELSERVEDALKRGALWEEVKNKLNEPGLALSGGQQQRLCIARAIAAEPELILMDEVRLEVQVRAHKAFDNLLLAHSEEWMNIGRPRRRLGLLYKSSSRSSSRRTRSCWSPTTCSRRPACPTTPPSSSRAGSSSSGPRPRSSRSPCNGRPKST